MTFNKFKMAIYSTYITNLYGFKLAKASDTKEKKRLRVEYSAKILNSLNIQVNIINEDKLPLDGQYLLVSNHRTILDPLIVEQCTKNSDIYGNWISKKELYNSLFFGKFVRNGGSILLDRESSQMGGFFKDIKEKVQAGDSIYIFPEGTRNKTQEAITAFKDGSQIIAVKNRLKILPIFIHSKANEILKEAIIDSSEVRIIDVEVGDIIDYKDRTLTLEENYKKQFNL